MKNTGKVLEDNWKKSMPEHVLYYRPPDAAQSFNMSSGLRFSQKSPCDCMLFNGQTGIFYTIEAKSVGTKSISFEKENADNGIIHKFQIENLMKFSSFKKVVSGFLLDFRLSENTYFLNINDFVQMSEKINKKSFNENDMFNYCDPILLEKKKMKVNFRYNIVKFLEETGTIYDE